MQDTTIDNALLALWRTEEAREHVEALMALRGVEKPRVMHDRPLSRGRCRWIVRGCLPCTTAQAADAIQADVIGITRMSAVHRSYMALCRLRDQGRVVQGFGPDGCLWRLAP